MDGISEERFPAKGRKTPVSLRASPSISDISTNGARSIGTREEKTAAEDPNCGDGGLGPELTVQNYGDYDAAVGHELVRQYYTVLCNAPEHV